MVANCVFFIVAGHETTSTLIAAGADLLCHHPAQRAALTADPSRWPAAVEEMLRYVSPTTLTGARARVDVEVEGERFEAGSQRLMFYAAANHDPGVFPDPDRFDIARSTKATWRSLRGHTTALGLRWLVWKPRSGCPSCSAASRRWPLASPSGVAAPHSGRSSPCPARGEPARQDLDARAAACGVAEAGLSLPAPGLSPVHPRGRRHYRAARDRVRLGRWRQSVKHRDSRRRGP